MPFLTQSDLTPPLYQEIINEITRNDATIVPKCILLGIGEAKSYLNRYDVATMFGEVPPLGGGAAFNDEYLNSLVKDIVCWQLIKLANPNIDIKLFRESYEDAIRYLKMVMKGEADPAWPLKIDDPTTPLDESGLISWTSNPKRSNYL